jgi:hypothetical protein
MGENPLKSDGKRHPSPLMENANNLSKNFDASVKKNRPRPPPLAGSQTPFWKIQCQRTENYSTEPVFLNVYGGPESIPRNEFHQPM